MRGEYKKSVYRSGGDGRSASNSRFAGVPNDDNVSEWLRDVLCAVKNTDFTRGAGTCIVLMLGVQAYLAFSSLMLMLRGTALGRMGKGEYLRSQKSDCKQ